MENIFITTGSPLTFEDINNYRRQNVTDFVEFSWYLIPLSYHNNKSGAWLLDACEMRNNWSVLPHVSPHFD